MNFSSTYSTLPYFQIDPLWHPLPLFGTHHLKFCKCVCIMTFAQYFIQNLCGGPQLVGLNNKKSFASRNGGQHQIGALKCNECFLTTR